MVLLSSRWPILAGVTVIIVFFIFIFTFPHHILYVELIHCLKCETTFPNTQAMKTSLQASQATLLAPPTLQSTLMEPPTPQAP